MPNANEQMLTSCRSNLRVSVWEHEQYESEPSLVPLESIVSPIMLSEAMVSRRKRWVSVFLNHVRVSCLYIGIAVLTSSQDSE
jgi:hypothetical protein